MQENDFQVRTNISHRLKNRNKHISLIVKFLILAFFIPKEYRAELYWRLENKRMKALAKENKPLNGVSADPNNNTDNSSEVLSEKMKVSENRTAK